MSEQIGKATQHHHLHPLHTFTTDKTKGVNEAYHVCTASDYFQFLSGRHLSAKALIKLDIDSKAKIKNFDITYLISREQLVFTNMATLCKLEEKH